VVALNHFVGDTDAEVAAVMDGCVALDVPARMARVWELGGEGGVELAQAVLDVLALARRDTGRFRFLYPEDLPLTKKLETLATALYGADGVTLQAAAAARLARLEALGYGRLPVCVAKTQNSLSDDPRKLGRPRGFRVTIRDVKLSAGAGFVVAYAGDILTMPGLPAHPAAAGMDVSADGIVSGLF
jgi:formate--tetrahydrofolate ligase